MKTVRILPIILISCLSYGSSFGQNNNAQTGPFEPYDNKLKDNDGGNKTGQANNIAVSTTNVPFDGGFSLVLAAGAGLAIKRARDKRKAVKQAL
jgi:hypothetical protein